MRIEPLSGAATARRSDGGRFGAADSSVAAATAAPRFFMLRSCIDPPLATRGTLALDAFGSSALDHLTQPDASSIGTNPGVWSDTGCIISPSRVRAQTLRLARRS